MSLSPSLSLSLSLSRLGLLHVGMVDDNKQVFCGTRYVKEMRKLDETMIQALADIKRKRFGQGLDNRAITLWCILRGRPSLQTNKKFG